MPKEFAGLYTQNDAATVGDRVYFNRRLRPRFDYQPTGHVAVVIPIPEKGTARFLKRNSPYLTEHGMVVIDAPKERTTYHQLLTLAKIS